MFIYGFPGDALKYIFSYWLDSRGLLDSVFPAQLVTFYFLKFITRFFGIIEGYNLSLLLASVLALVCSYALARRYVGRGPSVLVSLVYTSSNYFTWHGMQNVEIILAAALLPLFWSALLGLEERLNNGTSILFPVIFTSFAFAFVFFSSFYLGYFSLIFSIVFFLASRLADWRLEGKAFIAKKIIFAYFSFVCLSFFLTLPATYQFWQYFLGGLGGQRVRQIESGLQRNNLADLVAYGARPWDYLAPSIHQPLTGKYISVFYSYIRETKSYQYWSVFLPERANYLTFTGIGLTFYVIWTAFRSWRQKSRLIPPKDLRNVLLFLFVAIFMFLVSLPAVIEIKGFHLYFPSYFLFKVFPMFRVYARAGVFVLLSVSILTGYGLKLLLAKIRSDWFLVRLGRVSLLGRKSVVLITVLCGLIIFENLNFPPLTIIDVSKTPRVYDWIKNQPGEVKITEYPKDNSVVDLGGGCPSWLGLEVVRDYNGAYESFYQIFHGKVVLASSVLTKEERILAADLTEVGSYEVLKKHSVDYAVAHTKDPMIGTHSWPYPQENPLDECWRRRIMRKPEKVYSGFKQVAEFDDGVIYKVE